jgi:hypothetical protein
MTFRTASSPIAAILAAALLAGCTGSPSAPPKSETAAPEVKSELGKLSPDDRKLAEAQGTCPITGEALGSMGVPPKLVLKDRTVFLCCASCKNKAEAEPDKTLKAVDAKAKAAGK